MCAAQSLNFNELVNRIPDAPGSDYQLFLTTNEIPIKNIDKIKFCGNVAIGTSSTYILNLISKIKTLSKSEINYVIITDFSKSSKIFWTTFMIPALRDRTLTREDFIEKLKRNIYEHQGQYWPSSSTCNAKWAEDLFLNEVQTNESFLSNNERFDAIRSIAKNNGIIFKQANLYSPGTFKEIANAINTCNYSLGLLYVSNIADFVINPSEILGFSESVLQVCKEPTWIINACNTHTLSQSTQNIFQLTDYMDVKTRFFSHITFSEQEWVTDFSKLKDCVPARWVY